MKNIDELLGVAKLSELMSNDKKDESKKDQNGYVTRVR